MKLDQAEPTYHRTSHLAHLGWQISQAGCA